MRYCLTFEQQRGSRKFLAFLSFEIKKWPNEKSSMFQRGWKYYHFLAVKQYHHEWNIWQSNWASCGLNLFGKKSDYINILTCSKYSAIQILHLEKFLWHSGSYLRHVIVLTFSDFFSCMCLSSITVTPCCGVICFDNSVFVIHLCKARNVCLCVDGQ